MPKYILNINKKQKSVETDDDTPLLYVLRDYFQLNGPKFGCGLSQCGACKVLINGTATTSCMLPVSTIGKSEITTLEGIGTIENPHIIQKAIVKEQAAQCGYCLNGMVMSAVGLLNKKPKPNEKEIRKALEINLCRCGAHTRILKAVKNATKN